MRMYAIIELNEFCYSCGIGQVKGVYSTLEAASLDLTKLKSKNYLNVHTFEIRKFYTEVLYQNDICDDIEGLDK